MAALLLLFSVALEPDAHAQEPARRIALVIGNATYVNGGVLDNPEADADVVARKLTELGFVVTSDRNLGQGGMRDLVGAFMSQIRVNDLVLIYYSGHGVEADGRDYMLPVDVRLETPTSVQFQGIPLDILYSDQDVFGTIIVFDASRDNPFLRRVRGQIVGTHPLSPPVGSLVIFPSSGGDVAQDGWVDSAGRARANSVFATAFVTALSLPDASIQRVYQSLVRDVRGQTSNRQSPQRFGDLMHEFVFFRSESAPALADRGAAAGAVAPVSASRASPTTVTRSIPPIDPAAPRRGPERRSPRRTGGSGRRLVGRLRRGSAPSRACLTARPA